MNWLLILIIVLACPLMHFWMMKNDGCHKGYKNKKGGEKDA